MGVLPRHAILHGLVTVASIHAAACLGTHNVDEGDAFVDRSLPLDENCQVDLDAEGLAHGLYDINPGSGFCARDYYTRLRVNTYLALQEEYVDRAEHFAVQVVSAQVTLMGEDGEKLSFPDVDERMPNPFEEVTGVGIGTSPTGELSRASISVRTIPSTYAGVLSNVVGQTIVGEVRLVATDEYGDAVDIAAYSHRIEICDGCLTACGAKSTGNASDTGVCDDDGGQDDRVCNDPDC